MTAKKFLVIELMVFASVFIPVSFMPWVRFNGHYWNFTLAYGSLLILPICLFWRRRDMVFIVAATVLAWGLSAYGNLGLQLPGLTGSLRVELLGSIAAMCVLALKRDLIIISLVMLAYGFGLAFVEQPSFMQLGGLNLIFVVFVLYFRHQNGTNGEGNAHKAVSIEAKKAA